jgi:hypothetical protein
MSASKHRQILLQHARAIIRQEQPAVSRQLSTHRAASTNWSTVVVHYATNEKISHKDSIPDTNTDCNAVVYVLKSGLLTKVQVTE